MKVKMTIKNAEKFRIACEATDIRIEESKKYGQTEVMIVTVRHASQLYDAGLLQAEISSQQPAIESPVTIVADKETTPPKVKQALDGNKEKDAKK